MIFFEVPRIEEVQGPDSITNNITNSLANITNSLTNSITYILANPSTSGEYS